METEILISGPVGGNFALKRAIETGNCTVNFNSNGFVLRFCTKKEAKKALSVAWHKFLEDKKDCKSSCVSYTPGVTLFYDTSRALLCS